jgi:hypothetical protein
VLGIGLATHGPLDREAGVLLTPQPDPAWRGYPLAATLAEATGLPLTDFGLIGRAAVSGDAAAASLMDLSAQTPAVARLTTAIPPRRHERSDDPGAIRGREAPFIRDGSAPLTSYVTCKYPEDTLALTYFD